MSKKGENIYKRKDGRWEARYIKGYTLSGKCQYGYCYGKTYHEAKGKVERARAGITLGLKSPTENKQRLFSEYCIEWLALQKSRVKESSFVKYEGTVRLHILSQLGTLPVSKINEHSIERYKHDLLESGLSEKTVKDILVVLRAILSFISKQTRGMMGEIDISYPKEYKKEVRVLSVEEQDKLVSFLQTDMDESKFGVLLALLTGLRIGEICALRWEDISIEARTIKVCHSVQRIHNTKNGNIKQTHIVIGTPKSGTSVRIIPLTEKALQICKKMNPGTPSAYVLTGTSKLMEPRTVQRRLAQYTSVCGIAGVHFHTLRHTFATRCAEVGFELKSLSEILGHSDTSVTMNRYVHSSLSLKYANMEKLAKVGL